MLEDDLKISSDEEDSEQTAEKPKTRSTPPNILSSLLHLWQCLCWLLRGSVRCRRGLIKETEREIWPAALFSAREPGIGGAVSDPGATTSFL
ncbi:AF4/FMR2 family member 2 isoform X1 [Tachysurus ichikawai]